MARMRRNVFVAVAVLAVTFLTAPTAEAERYVRVDPLGDMIHQPLAGPDVLDPGARNGDIRRVVVRHGLARVTIRVKMAALHLPPGGFVVVDGLIKPNRAARLPSDGSPSELDTLWEWHAAWSSRRPHRPSIEVLDALHQEVGGCYSEGNKNLTGLRAHIDYQREVIFVAIPRGCITRTSGMLHDPVFGGPLPRWVQVSVGSEVTKGDATRWADLFKGPSEFGYGEPLRFTPRLYAGRGLDGQPCRAQRC